MGEAIRVCPPIPAGRRPVTATDLSALLRGVLERPEDDAPRLVYADAVEEAGDEWRARHIRHACGPAERTKRYPVVAGGGTAGIVIERPDWCDTVWTSRGFIDSVTCPCAAWLAHGPAMVRRQPIARVELSD